jgi:hypothetical protein
MPADTLDNKALRELLDRDAIRELAVRYCHCMWQHDIAVVSLFSPDGRFGAKQGREALERFYAGVFAGSSTPHPFAGNHVIDFDGPDHATGTCYNDLRIDRGGHALVIGYWKDEYVRVGGAWKFKSRDFTTVQEFRPTPSA